MVNKKRINALASLAEDMNVQTHVRANEKISSIPNETGPKVKKQRVGWLVMFLGTQRARF